MKKTDSYLVIHPRLKIVTFTTKSEENDGIFKISPPILVKDNKYFQLHVRQHKNQLHERKSMKCNTNMIFVKIITCLSKCLQNSRALSKKINKFFEVITCLSKCSQTAELY